MKSPGPGGDDQDERVHENNVKMIICSKQKEWQWK